MMITNKIYQVLGGMYANIANIFIIKEKDFLIMIDAAENEYDYTLIEDNLKRWGLIDYQIAYVLVTHKHQGHIGNLKKLKDNGSTIIAGEGDAKDIEMGNINSIIDFSPFPERENYKKCKIDILVNDNEILCLGDTKVRCIAVPGHTSGSMMYQVECERQIILFAGDIIKIEKDCHEVSLGWEGGEDFNAQQYFDSISKIINIPCDILLPSHGQICMTNGHKMFKLLMNEALLKWRKPSIIIE